MKLLRSSYEIAACTQAAIVMSFPRRTEREGKRARAALRCNETGTSGPPHPSRACPDVAPSVAASRATSPDGGGCGERDVEDAVPYRCRDLLHLFSLSAPARVIRRARTSAESPFSTRSRIHIPRAVENGERKTNYNQKGENSPRDAGCFHP